MILQQNNSQELENYSVEGSDSVIPKRLVLSDKFTHKDSSIDTLDK